MESSEALQYRDLWYGKETFETNKNFTKRHIDDCTKFEALIKDKGLTILSKEKVTSSISRYKVKDGSDSEFFIVYSPLTHSGDKNNRLRSHIPPAVINNKSTDYVTFLVAPYNAGDVIIYVFGNITDFINRSESKKFNTSFWIGDIEKLFDIYKSGESYWYRDREDVLLLGGTSVKLKDLPSDLFADRYLCVKPETDNHSEEVNEELSEDEKELKRILDLIDANPVKFDENFLHENLQTKLKRNKDYRKAALLRAKYTCELCGKTSTFKTKNGDEYFDGHHLIMYNPKTQERFEYSLDIPKNIVCLCPECHKKIHFSKDEDVKDMLLKLFMKHKDLFKIYEIESLDEIINDYFNYREEEI